MNKVILVIGISLLLGACYNSERSETNINTTFGQELTDLKKALDNGAIDDKQYQKIVNKLADRRLRLDLDEDE